MPEQENTQHQHRCHGQGQHQHIPRAPVDALRLARAYVLPHKGGGRRAEGKVGHHGKAVHAHDRHAGGDHRRAQGVGQPLHDDGGQGENRLGHARGQAKAAQLAGQLTIQAQGTPGDRHHIPHPPQPNQAQDAGDALGDDGGPRHARHAQAEVFHKHNVQHNVHQAGQQQVQQRKHAVAHAAQHAGKDVVQRTAHHAQEQNLKIRHRPGLHLRGRIDQANQHGGCKVSHHHHEQAAQDRQGDGVAHHQAEVLLVLRAEELGGQDGGAGGHAHKQHQQQVQDWAGGAHGRQGRVAHILADDDGVHRVVQLLGQVADQQRNGKPDQPRHGLSLRHVLHAKKALEFFLHGHWVILLFFPVWISHITFYCTSIGSNTQAVVFLFP